ncbi:complement component C1q receptor isoform X1 [Mauremys mutica]|uniref:complement component C1q receptor isoform X1 n=1 Tax=Mauremys mutica TaxID=74926 RepID=UPI001D16243A|nr:complement component C1q receptor isoform X1 [Mauremys mutica]
MCVPCRSHLCIWCPGQQQHRSCRSPPDQTEASMGIALFFLGQVLLWGVPSWASEEAEALCARTACYTIHWGVHNWADAQEKCKSNGGNLVTMKSQEEALHVQDLLAKLPRREAGPEGQARLWIGLHREKGKCYQRHQLLKGFSWASGGEETDYTGWLREPRETCTGRRCVSLHWNSTAPGSSALGWADGPCSGSSARAQGYLCKFSFQGMCRQLALAGPGSVTYTTPFGLDSAALAAVPFGSQAAVRCQGQAPGPFPVCKAQAGGGFEWSSPGPLCASPRHGCGYSNGGCQHQCLELAGGSFRCACRPGYQLGGDLLSCSPVDHCGSQPCQGECLGRPGGFECRCPAGYALAGDGVSCADVDECRGEPCQGRCVNTPGGFACTCPPGYEPAGPGGRRCRDVDECARGAPCAQLCANTPGSFLCACRPGYQRGRDGASCRDVDECRGEPCQGRCVNQPGSYQCLCPPGWALAPSGVSCLSGSSPASPGSAAPSPRPPGEEEPAAGGGHPPGTQPATESPAPRSDPTTRAQPGGAEPSTLEPAAVSSAAGAGEPMMKADADQATDGPKLLLYYILGSVVVILLLMAFALGLLIYRKRKAKEEKKKAKKSTTDNYCWVLEQAEKKAVDNDYSRSQSLQPPVTCVAWTGLERDQT